MHTFTTENNISFHYNSDLSGEVIITTTKGENEIKVPGADLLAFFAEYIRSERIRKIEEMSDEQIINGETNG